MKLLNSVLTRAIVMVLIITMLLSSASISFAAKETWNNGAKVNYVPASGEKTFKVSAGAKYLTDLYQLSWYQDPAIPVLKGELMWVAYRVINASSERNGLGTLLASKEVLKFKDAGTLSAAAQEIAKYLQSIGVISGNPNGNMELDAKITRAQAAKILAILDKKFLKISSVNTPKGFVDTKGNWSEKNISITHQTNLLTGIANDTNFMPNSYITREDILKILEAMVGHFGILREDVVKAMSETFKITANATKSNSTTSYTSYVKYEEKMKLYGLDKFYANGSAKSSEPVTIIDSLRLNMVISLDKESLESFIVCDQLEDNQFVLNYSQYYEVAKKDIDINSCKEKVKYIDAIESAELSKILCLPNLPIKDTQVIFKDFNKYSAQQQKAVKDMVANGIIYPYTDVLNGDQNMCKGQLNEIVINFVEKYNTIEPTGGIINTDPHRMPNNAYMYPYILSSVYLNAYEFPLYCEYTVRRKSPIEVYNSKRGKDYDQIAEKCEQYFDLLINIDYRTINSKDFKDKIARFTAIYVENDVLNEYITYVKENQIVLKGSSQAQLPIIYSDGQDYRVRMRVQFEVVSSKTSDCLLYPDFLEYRKTTYTKKTYDIYVDGHMYIAMEVDDDLNPSAAQELFIHDRELTKAILDRKNCGIVVQEVKRK